MKGPSKPLLAPLDSTMELRLRILMIDSFLSGSLQAELPDFRPLGTHDVTRITESGTASETRQHIERSA